MPHFSVCGILRGAGWSLNLLLLFGFGSLSTGAAEPQVIASGGSCLCPIRPRPAWREPGEILLANLKRKGGARITADGRAEGRAAGGTTCRGNQVGRIGGRR